MQRYTTFILISILLSLIHAEITVNFTTNNCFNANINTFEPYILNLDETITKGIKATFSKDDSKLFANCGDRTETFLYTCKGTI